MTAQRLQGGYGGLDHRHNVHVGGGTAAFLCLDLPRPLPTLFEACIDIDLGGECVNACESLPEPFWACVSQDTFFDLESWKQGVVAEGRTPSDEETEARLVRVMCERLARCAGAPPPELFGEASAGPPEAP